MRQTFLAAALALVCLPAADVEGVTPVDEQIQVNTTAPGWQGSSSVAALAGGGFVAAWTSEVDSAADEFRIRARRFNAHGTAVGDDFQVDAAGGEGVRPRVAGLAGGGFVVVWARYDSTSPPPAIQGRRYAADGTPAAEPFRIDTAPDDSRGSPTVAAFPGGGFVVAWHSRVAEGSPFRIRARIYSADGTPAAEQFQLSPEVPSNHWYPSVAAFPEGGFVVVWSADTSSARIEGQRRAADGTPAGEVFEVNSHTSGFPGFPEVAVLAGGGFFVAWMDRESGGTDASGESIQGRRFAADGSAAGAEHQVNTFTDFDQLFPSVAALPDGGFAVVWYSQDRTGVTRQSTHAQLYGADGLPMEEEIWIGFCTDLGHWAPSVTALADSFVVTWTSRGSCGPDVSGTSIQGQRFATPRFALVGLAGKCLDVEGAVPADGTPVNLFRCHGGANQRWRLDLTSAPQRIRGLGEKCLVPGPVDASGDVRMVIGECGGPEDRWQLLAPWVSRPSILLHVETGLCLDVEAGASADGTPAILFECHGRSNQLWRPAPAVCTRDSQGLCLNRDRFRVDVEWRDYAGNTGSSRVVPVGSDDSGLFWFFHRDNWEMLIKVLDGCGFNDRFWVYAAATTDVEYTLRVTDTAVGAIEEYFNPLGTASSAITDSAAFATCAYRPSIGVTSPHPVAAPADLLFGLDRSSRDAAGSKGACVPGPSDLCLNDDRFLVEVEWRDFDGNTGSGWVVPVDSRDSGLFWFFSQENWEMLIKVLDGCGLNDRYWVYAAATTNVEYRLRVTDLDSGEIREYFNPLGNASPATTDTQAFATCR